MAGKLARALYTNNVDSKQELFFRKGEILTVIEFDYEGQEGWWLCTLGGDRGLCPGNYLELLEDKYSLPVISNAITNVERDLNALDLYDVPRSHQEILSAQNGQSDPLQDYDFPRNESPVFGPAPVTRVKQLGSEGSLLSSRCSSNSNRVSSVSSSSSSAQSSTSLDGPSVNSYRLRNQFPNNTYANSQFHGQDTTDFRSRSDSGNGSFMSSKGPVYQNSAEISDPLADYDVPRSSQSVKSFGSRPQSSMSMSGSEFISFGSSGSKDSLDTYDVPRSQKNCVSRFESKYDQVPHRSRQSSLTQSQNNLKRASVCSTSSNGSSSVGRNIEKCFGVVLRNTGNGVLKKSDSVASNGSNFNSEPSETYDVPPSTASRSSASVKSWSASTCSRLDLDPDQHSVYDIPAEFSRQVSLCGSTETLSYQDGPRASFSSGRQSRGSFSHRNSDNGLVPVEVKILPLCPKAAVSVSEKLRQEVITSINSILGFVKPNWRVKDNLREIMPELRFGCVRLNLAIKDLTEFCSRTVSNAKKLGLDSIVLRLQRLLNPLANGSHIIQKDVDELEAYLWSVERLGFSISETAPTADALDQLVLCARSLQHDVTEIANFIALNSTALFLDEDPATLPVSTTPVLPAPQSAPPVDDDQEDYDYVTLASMEEANQNRQISNTSITATATNPVSSTDSKDQHLLEFYSAQVATIAPLLSQSISSFISSVHQNDPPKVFNGHLKYVILLAYKMLFAGDTVHRNIINPEIKNDVEAKSDELHKAVVELHEASKVATRDFPKILPMQKIVDNVWQTTAAATELKKVIFNACV